MLECEAFQIYCSLLSFETLEIFPAFPALLRKKDESLGKNLFDKNGPKLYLSPGWGWGYFGTKAYTGDVPTVSSFWG